MKKIFLIASIFIHQISYCQKETDFGSLAVLVQTAKSSGSGFYLTDTSSNSLYFVTACHVLVDPNGNFISDSIHLVSYKKNSQVDSRDIFRISLSSALKNGSFAFDVKKDIAVLLLAKSQNRALAYGTYVTKVTQTSTYLNSWDINDSKKISELKTTDEIFTIGYPKSLTLISNFDFNRPLVRKGILAGIDFQKKRIIADLATYQGNSGGMVVEASLINRKDYLVGVVSQFVPFEERWRNEAYGYANTNVYNSGYSVLIPCDYILEQIAIIKNHK